MSDNLGNQQSGSNQSSENDINMSVFDEPIGQGQLQNQVPNQADTQFANQDSEDFDFFEDAGVQKPVQQQQQAQLTEEEINNLPESQKEAVYLKDPEMRARSFQSKYDKALAELNQIKTQSEQYRKAYELLNEASTDEDIRNALIAQLNPEAANQFDIDAYVAKKMTKEFGEDFQFDPQLAHVPGPHFRYAERMRSLYQNVENEGVGKLKTIKEIKEQRKLEQQKQEIYMQQQVETIRNSYPGISDDDIRSTVQFAEKLTLADFYKIRRFMARQTGQKTPFVGGISGGNPASSGMSKQMTDWLNSF